MATHRLSLNALGRRLGRLGGSARARLLAVEAGFKLQHVAQLPGLEAGVELCIRGLLRRQRGVPRVQCALLFRALEQLAKRPQTAEHSQLFARQALDNRAAQHAARRLAQAGLVRQFGHDALAQLCTAGLDGLQTGLHEARGVLVEHLVHQRFGFALHARQVARHQESQHVSQAAHVLAARRKQRGAAGWQHGRLAQPVREEHGAQRVLRVRALVDAAHRLAQHGIRLREHVGGRHPTAMGALLYGRQQHARVVQQSHGQQSALGKVAAQRH